MPVSAVDEASSGRNFETFVAYLDAFRKNDFKAARELLDRDVEWWGSSYVPAPYRGHKGVHNFWDDWRRGWQDFVTTLEEDFEIGDRLVVTLHDSGRGEESGLQIQRRTALALTFRDGKIFWARVCRNKEEALKVLGLAGEPPPAF